jgi:hypothetical protein
VEFLDLFVKVLKKCRITDSQVFFLTVELIEGHRLEMLGLLDGRVMLGGERCAQCGQLTKLKQRIEVHGGHHDNDEQ